MNLYNILNIKNNASKKEIKKAYRRLALKFHPDKNKLNKNYNIKKFHNIQIAYETLIDNNKRKMYDSMSYSEQLELYNLFNQYFDSVSPKYKSIYKSIIGTIYNDENEFKDDINNFNFVNIFEKIKNNLIYKYNSIFSDIPNIENKKNININATLLEKYKNMFKKLTYKNNIYTIPLRESQCIIPINKNNQILININTTNNTNFKIINDIDLIITKFITLEQYIKGGYMSFKHIDDSIIEIEFKSYIGKNPIHKIPNKGLPFVISEENEEFIESNIYTDNIDRGDLYLKFDVKNIL